MQPDAAEARTSRRDGPVERDRASAPEHPPRRRGRALTVFLVVVLAELAWAGVIVFVLLRLVGT